MKQDDIILKSNISSDKKSKDMPKKKKEKRKIPWQLIILIVIVVVGAFSWNYVRSSNLSVEKKAAETAETARPANLEITFITDKSCTDCSSLDVYTQVISELNVKITKRTSLDKEDKQAQSLIKKYSIGKVPYMVVAGEIDKFAELSNLWKAWGITDNSTFVLTSVIPPFVNLKTGEVDGRVSVVYLDDTSCDECYDVKTNKEILEKYYAVKLIDEKSVDISSAEGKDLIQKYEITKIPTFLLDGEAATYPGLASVWPNVGTVESDGWYLFTGVEQLGVYYDLETKEVVNPADKKTEQDS